MIKKISVVIILLTLSASAHAGPALDAGQFSRLRAVKFILNDVDVRSIEEMARDLQKTSFPEGHLRLLEATAKTYNDLIHDYPQATRERKKWLYGMVQLNLAYLQLGGGETAATSALNTLIQRTLLKYAQPETLSDPRLLEPSG